LRYYIFKPDANEIIAKTYSPSDAQYKTESNQQFILFYPFTGVVGYVSITNPTDDALANHNLPDDNFGSVTYLGVRADGTSKGRNSFLKFTVSGITGSVTSAKLKMYSQDLAQSIYAKVVSNTSWTEGAITWNNQPTIGSILDTQTASASSWVEFDVTSHVTGNGTYSICLTGSIDATGGSFDSKENTNKPVLEVTYQDETIAGDIDNDYMVDFFDFAVLADQWYQLPGAPSADIAPPPYGDGIVDFLDLVLVAAHWLEGL
jgi:hypothetical protein